MLEFYTSPHAVRSRYNKSLILNSKNRFKVIITYTAALNMKIKNYEISKYGKLQCYTEKKQNNHSIILFLERNSNTQIVFF